MVENRTTHTIPCMDAIGRPRVLEVVGTAGGITFITPAGGSGQVHPKDYEQLRIATREAFNLAVRGSLSTEALGGSGSGGVSRESQQP